MIVNNDLMPGGFMI